MKSKCTSSIDAIVFFINNDIVKAKKRRKKWWNENKKNGHSFSWTLAISFDSFRFIRSSNNNKQNRSLSRCWLLKWNSFFVVFVIFFCFNFDYGKKWKSRAKKCQKREWSSRKNESKNMIKKWREKERKKKTIEMCVAIIISSSWNQFISLHGIRFISLPFFIKNKNHKLFQFFCLLYFIIA